MTSRVEKEGTRGSGNGRGWKEERRRGGEERSRGEGEVRRRGGME